MANLQSKLLGSSVRTKAEPPDRPRRKLWLVLRLAFSALLLLLLLRRIAAAELAEAFANAWANWPLLLFAYTLPMMGVLLGAVRWQTLMKIQGVHLPVVAYTRALLVGVWFNQVLPSTIGGDIARSVWVTKRDESPLINVAVVTLDRVVGILVLCLLALVCALLSPTVKSFMPLVWAVPALLMAAAIAIIIAMVRHGGAFGDRLFSLPLLHRYRDKAKQVYGALGAYHWSPLAWAALLSLGIQLLLVMQYIVFARALGLGLPENELALIVPIVVIISMVPVTINGLGLREGAFALLGASIGLRPSDAVALGGLFAVGQVFFGLVGGVIHVRGPRE